MLKLPTRELYSGILLYHKVIEIIIVSISPVKNNEFKKNM
jgi:hypothetical protein